MKTEWDYTPLAEAYVRRPGYAETAIDELVSVSGGPGRVCDVGAGVAHLTLMLAARDCKVTAVEPNDAMREIGQRRTTALPAIRWFEGTGEATGQPDRAFDVVTFGSSFNVTDRPRALVESQRILRPEGWFACLWNHRDLDEPVQARIESIIADAIPGYTYGARREDQSAVIDRSGLFGPVVRISGATTHRQSVDDVVEAWRSHATLQRQAGAAFSTIVSRIANFLGSLPGNGIDVPYTTNIWMAQAK